MNESIEEALRKARDPEVRSKLSRDTWGPRFDDYWRQLSGKESYYNEQARKENEEYWKDYMKNTGTEPKYPIRTGSEWNQPIDTLPNAAISTGKRAIQMLYGGQE